MDPSSTLICIIYRKSQIFKKENSRNIKENKIKSDEIFGKYVHQNYLGISQKYFQSGILKIN